MIHNDKNQKFLQNRTSGDADRSFFKKMYYALCPCIATRGAYAQQRQASVPNTSKGSNMTSRTIHKKEATHSQEMSTISSRECEGRESPRKQNAKVFKSVIGSQSSKPQLEPRRSVNLTPAQPISQVQQEVITALGNQHNKMLVKIATQNIMPPKHIQLKTQKEMDMGGSKSFTSNPKLESFWSKRYLLFDKFDMGIKMDEDSWETTIPEAVAEYMSMRIKCATVLDGFCGVGSSAIKFARTCPIVLANDRDYAKIQCLEVNQCIYGVDNITRLTYDFLDLPQIKADVVYLTPRPNFSDTEQQIHPCQFTPPLPLTIQKALSITNNVVLLLPSNININELCSIFSQALNKAYPKNSSCFLQIQKIYFLKALKYVAVYYGPLVNKQGKLEDELKFIYRQLGWLEEQGAFEHVKLVRDLRQKFGMVALLNWTYQCRRYEGTTLIDKFDNLIMSKQLMTEEEMHQLEKYEQKRTRGQSRNEQEKFDIDARTERTHSFVTNEESSSFSANSHHSHILKRVRMTVQLPEHMLPEPMHQPSHQES